MMKGDKKVKSLGSKLNVAERLDAGMFMVNMPQECAKEMSSN